MFKDFDDNISSLIEIFFIAVLLVVVNSNTSIANEKTYFATLKSNKVNMRSGPGIEYPIRWIYKYQNLPIEVIGQFEKWKKVRDIYGDEGWISKNLLNNRAFIIVKNDTIGYKQPYITQKPIMKIEKFVIMKLNECKEEWCQVKYKKHLAWVAKKNLWGVK